MKTQLGPVLEVQGLRVSSPLPSGVMGLICKVRGRVELLYLKIDASSFEKHAQTMLG